MVLKISFFQNRYVELHGKKHLKFSFWLFDSLPKEEEDECHIIDEFRSSSWEELMKMKITVTIVIKVLRTWKCSVFVLHLSRTKLCQASKYLSSALFLQFVHQGVGGHVHWIQLKFLAILEFSPRTDGWHLFPLERNFDIHHFLGRSF